MFEALALKIGMKAIPWKQIGIALIFVVVIGVIIGGYAYVQNLQNELVETKSDLARETLLKEAERARADSILVQHDAQVIRLEALETQRTDIALEVSTLRQQLQDLDIEQDIQSDQDDKADRAVAAFNARNRELNRLLERASGKPGRRDAASEGSKAGPARPASALRRAVQALRR